MDKTLAGNRIVSEAELDALYDPTLQISLDIELDFLDPHLQSLVENSRFVCLATESKDGIDVTPRGGEAGFVRHCHVKSASDTGIVGRNSSRGHGSIFPYIECFGSILFEGGAVDDVALEVECVVDGGLDVQESLGGAR